ncbi:MAG: endonuclease domain-containing protein [Bauldia sp.]
MPAPNKRNARAMRREMTPAEVRLWLRLNRRQLDGLRFRRQATLGNYIVDFFCPERHLIVEIDGDHHGHDAVVVADAARTTWLETQGHRVLRFSNSDVMSNLDGVYMAIWEAATAPLPKSPTAI